MTRQEAAARNWASAHLWARATERCARHRIRVVARLASLLACGSTNAFALQLGEAVVRSAIGQPLVVQVPYRLAPGEQLTPACIGLAPAPRADRALPTY